MAVSLSTGAPCRSERLAKYNQRPRIEEALGSEARCAVVLEFPLQTVTKDYCTLDAMAAGCFAPNIKPNGEEVIKAASYMDQMRLDVAASEFYTAT
ncbi:hypothetical protein ON010_g5804 [Phytophthora cinnamomi]|nr:hypothetical protein ON010_g5804 [Phytophthora cinnamomi]